MAEPNEPLSERELDVLALLVQGATNKDIAGSLFISPNTVKVHLRNIYTKLGVSTRTEATVVAVEQQLVTLSGEIQPAVDEPAVDPPVTSGERSMAEATAPAEPQDPVEEEPAAAGPVETAAPSRRSRWLWPAVAAGALIVALAALFAPQLSGLSFTNGPAATPVPAEDVQIAETRWFVTQTVDRPVWGGVLVSAGVDLFLVGGQGESGTITGDVFVFDSTTRAWRAAAAKPTPVREAGGANLGGFLYIVGGQNGDGEPVNLVEAYSPSDNVWGPVANLPRPLFGGVVVQDGGLLYYLGGHDGQQAVPDAYVYDPSTDGWRELPPLLHPQAFGAGGFVDNALFVVGGENGDGLLDLCQKFDLQSQAWSECPPPSRPRSRAGAAVVLNKLYILGGQTDAHFGELFDPKAGTWEIINVPMLDPGDPSDWVAPAVTNVEAKIYLIGGRLADGQINDVSYVYAPLVYRAFFPATQAGSGPDR